LASRAHSKPRRRRPRRKPATTQEPRSRRAFAFTATAVGIVSSVVALVFTFRPDLQPGRSPSEQSATLGNLVADTDAPFGQYLARIDQPSGSYTARQLERRGALLDFRVTVTGFKGKHLRLKWELFADTTGRQINESKAIVITPTNYKDAANWQFWIPLPHRRGPFFAVVELLEQKRYHTLRLDTLRTRTFHGLE
jgi:hypothetical protein